MKAFFTYIGKRKNELAAAVICAALLLASFVMYRLPMRAVVYPLLLCLLTLAVFFVLGYAKNQLEHKKLSELKKSGFEGLENTDSSRLDADYYEIMRLLSDEHSASLSEGEQKLRDISDYYTVWVHQIKTPIASMKLKLESEDSAFSRRLSGELRKIEQYVEMVTIFLRLGSESTDYVIEKHRLDTIVRAAIKKLSGDFIDRRLKLEYEATDTVILTDEKWFSFVIEQILSNAVKYTPSGGVTVSVSGNVLCISDTGIGIDGEDLPRIFEKGYTGHNGRREKSSTGLGLYLCKRVCENLGHVISAESKPDEGTRVYIDFSHHEGIYE